MAKHGMNVDGNCEKEVREELKKKEKVEDSAGQRSKQTGNC